ncbi:MAG TPA: HAMP domain-containing sensor histidine kinase, partial [Polyangiaceae bacterium]|nr:HAMP domain-containing sensor histidine kinase [Polyangiaceae bacterium]
PNRARSLGERRGPERVVTASARRLPNRTEEPEFNLRVLWPLARYMEDRGGREELETFARGADLIAADFEVKNQWVSWETYERVLANAREILGDEDTFKTACTHRMEETYGPARFFFWAASPSLMYKTIEGASRFFSTVGRFQLVDRGRNFARLRWTSSRPESRLMCLARQAQACKIPALWGLPAAMVREHSCMSRGDKACEYHFYWYSRRSGIFSLTAFALVALATIHEAPDLLHTPIGWTLPALAATLAHIYEMFRSDRADRGTREEVTDALRRLVTEEAEARREIVLLHQRQREWTRMLEEESVERSAIMAQIAERVEQLHHAREKTLLGFSHDLRNPLTAIQFSADYLRDNAQLLDAEGKLVVQDLESAIAHMRSMLAELMVVASAQRNLMTLAPKTIEVAGLVERLRRRVRALVHGREDVRATVVASRSAPTSIEMDPLLLDRVLDNLLTNAAKYTDRGAITVEVDGARGFLVIRVSDTGRGIKQDELERTFHAGGSDPHTRAKNSYGVGLSVVVQLLGSIGGTLEVMSKPGRGTTFWVRFPVKLERGSGQRVLESDTGDILSRVVKIRKSTTPV